MGSSVWKTAELCQAAKFPFVSHDQVNAESGEKNDPLLRLEMPRGEMYHPRPGSHQSDPTRVPSPQLHHFRSKSRWRAPALWIHPQLKLVDEVFYILFSLHPRKFLLLICICTSTLIAPLDTLGSPSLTQLYTIPFIVDGNLSHHGSSHSSRGQAYA